jgi:hypothetical protein
MQLQVSSQVGFESVFILDYDIIHAKLLPHFFDILADEVHRDPSIQHFEQWLDL